MIVGFTEAKLLSSPRPPGALDELRALAKIDGGLWWFDDADPKYQAIVERYGAGRDLEKWINSLPPPAQPVGVESPPLPGAKGERTQSIEPHPWGPARWRELHEWAMKLGRLNDDNKIEAWRWLGDFTAKIPCGECKCDWVTLRATLRETDDLFAWSVGVHNAINRKLGKAEMDIGAVRELYGSVENLQPGYK